MRMRAVLVGLLLPAAVAAQGLTPVPPGASFGTLPGQVAQGNDTRLYPYNLLWGTSADGNVTISSGTVTLTRDMHYRNLTISGTGKLNTNGWRVFVSGTLDLSAAGTGALSFNGVSGYAASGSVGATTPGTFPTRFVPGAMAPTNGATGTTGTGSAAASTSAATFLQGGSGASGNSGGASGTSVAGSAAGGGQQVSQQLLYYPSPFLGPWIVTNATITPISVNPGGASGGGGAGGGDGSNAGGGGGSGAVAGGHLHIYARYIQRGANVATGIMQSIGGAGGAGGNAVAGSAGGGGGGGGAGGGFVYIVTEQLLGSTITGAIDVSGGNGGAGGNGQGTGKGGNGGGGGNSGNVQIVNVGAPSFTASSFNQPGTAGSTTSTATGAAGGAGATLQVGL